ncbi:MAG: preprotein translocase subunit SecE [Caldimicrobium sp.]|nr:preprotein translocase subunit SecE [Caldimicrobium sp.]MCX7873075.1 preprotein translocase subunit SecE [Caldimicrobium sp.]MDW8094500.1 preprotein translocase subunit SecE [Caldimicrobium sp.]
MVELLKKASPQSASNIINRGLRFLKEVKIEGQKITWAGRKQVLMSSLMVIFLSIFIGAYLGLLDIIYNFIISLLVK